MELLFNLLIVGCVIIIIESNFQLFRSITFNSMTDIFMKCVTQTSYRKWAYRNRGTVATESYSGKMRYFATLFTVLVARLVGGFDFFQAFMQFLMSVTSISKFVEVGGGHDFSPECNVVENFIGYDENIAFLASCQAWIILLPIIYEVSNILIPGFPKGIPEGMKAADSDSAKKPDPQSSILHVFKYGSVASPDLWLSSLASMWVRTVQLATPLTTARREIRQVGEHAGIVQDEKSKASPTKADTTPSAAGTKLDDLEGGEVKNPRQRGKHSIMHYDGTEESMLRIRARTEKTNPCFRVVSSGEQGNLEMQCGLYFALPGYSTKVWSSYNDLHVAKNACHLCVIDRKSGEVDLASAYDIIGDSRATEGLNHLVDALNALNDTKIVVVFTTGTPGTYHRLAGGLDQALDRCGGTGDFYKTAIEEDSTYVLIGIPGKGKGTGCEVIQGGGKAANIDLNFEITSDGFEIRDIEKGVFDNYRWLSNNSYIFASFQKRTKDENDKWRAVQKKSMPSYYTLCRLEHEELCAWFAEKLGCGNLLSPLTLSMSICGLGHFFTEIGREAWSYVVWKIGRFFLLCLGYWTDDIVEMYEIHKLVREMSVVWEKPFKRKSKEAYDAYRLQLRGKQLENREDAENNTGKPKKCFKDYFMSLPAWMTPEKGCIEDSSHEETVEIIVAQQEELKRKLRADYAAMLYAIVATRAVLLQAFSSLTFLSIYASTMSATPIMVHSDLLARNLPELIISEPFVEARAQEQESIDEQEWIRRANLTEHQNCVPNPEYRVIKGKLVKISNEERVKIENGNARNRTKMKKIINLPTRTVDEWIVAINGTALFITESRGINFLLNLYKFVLTVGITLTTPDKLKYWMASSAIVLVPYCLLGALSAVAMAGKTLYITDGDINDAFGCVGMTCFYDYLRRYTGKAQEVNNSAGSQKSSASTDGGANEGNTVTPASILQSVSARIGVAMTRCHQYILRCTGNKLTRPGKIELQSVVPCSETQTLVGTY